MNIFFFIAAIIVATAHATFVVRILRDQMIEKWKNILIYEDADFTNRKMIIRGDWDSLLHGKRIKRSLVLFSFLRRSSAAVIFGVPFMVGMMMVIAYGDTDGSMASVVLNKELYFGTVICMEAIVILGMIYHAVNLPKYKLEAEQQKALEETKEILK